jgi:hypothetical protein
MISSPEQSSRRRRDCLYDIDHMQKNPGKSPAANARRRALAAVDFTTAGAAPR